MDKGYLCCAHHRVMVAGLAMLGVGNDHNKGRCICQHCLPVSRPVPTYLPNTTLCLTLFLKSTIFAYRKFGHLTRQV